MPRSLDAALLTGWVRAATQALERHRAEIDRINVFPVPDGDTGTNLLLTMRSAAESLRRGPRDGKSAGAVDDDPAAGAPDGLNGAPALVDAPPNEAVAESASAEAPPADGASAAAVAATLARGALLGLAGTPG